MTTSYFSYDNIQVMTNNIFWDELDHFLYYDFWHREGHDSSIEIRKKNLYEFKELTDKYKINFDITGDTLEYIVINSKLNTNSKSDNFSINYKEKDKFLNAVANSKFKLIDLNKRTAFLYRNNRLLRISFSKFLSYYINKKNELFLDDIELSYSTFNKNILYISLPFRKFVYKLLNKIRVFNLKMKNEKDFFFFSRRLNIDDITRTSVYEMNLKTFLNLKIENELSVNWLMRRKHLDIVTKNKENIKVKEIIKYFSNKTNLTKKIKSIKQTDNLKTYKEPISHNKSFWNSGNNYFINNLLYGFRKNVIPYSKANKYIKEVNKPNLYSKDYYESLEVMSDKEIKKFLEDNPIEVTNNSVTSGKHRVFAMINRLLEDKEYIPIYVEVG